MNIIIRETGQVKNLSIIDRENGVDFIADFLGNAGALDNGEFERSKKYGYYVCNQDTYNWWDAVVTDNQSLNDRIHDLELEHGRETVWNAIHDVSDGDLEYHAAKTNQALDDAFGQPSESR